MRNIRDKKVKHALIYNAKEREREDEALMKIVEKRYAENLGTVKYEDVVWDKADCENK